MGIVAFQWGEGDKTKLMLLMNRDNWGNRVISGASWDEKDQILSGRCEANHGTWLGISKRGRVAFLVNTAILLDHVDDNDGSELYPIEFLESNVSPQQFAEDVAKREKNRGWAYSLIVADMNSKSMVHIRKPDQDKRKVVVEPVPFGVHTLSSYEGLDCKESPSRDLRLSGHFTEMIGNLGNDEVPPMKDIAGKFMYKTEGGRHAVFLETTDEHPNMELGMQRYGTTSTTALAVKHTKEVMFFERYMDENGEWNELDLTFNIQ